MSLYNLFSWRTLLGLCGKSRNMIQLFVVMASLYILAAIALWEMAKEEE